MEVLEISSKFVVADDAQSSLALRSRNNCEWSNCIVRLTLIALKATCIALLCVTIAIRTYFHTLSDVVLLVASSAPMPQTIPWANPNEFRFDCATQTQLLYVYYHFFVAR